jgi:hypothetical protein
MINLKNNFDYVFFLGGSDAEMLEIKNILIQHRLIYFDKNLSWGAKSSDYADELTTVNNQIPVLIELTLDTAIPNNSIIINHHNECETNKSSIEQVAELLGIELNRWQKLIAANDKGFVPEMERICATKEEIKKVRAADRKAQGVTEEDERLADESIEKNKTVENGITVIKSLTEKFSPISDRMYGKTDSLLVSTDHSLTYYGKMKNQLVAKYKNLVDEKKAYYGGGALGFFGLAKEKITIEEVSEIKKEILEMKQEVNEKLYSHHIFIFPFKWRIWNIDEEKASLHEKFDVRKFADGLQNSGWERKKFELKNYDHYNEFNYFYDHVREVLYDLHDTIKPLNNNDDLINHFEFNFDEGQKYNIRLYGEDKLFSLDIDSIILNIYKTGTAVLSFHLRNHSYSDEYDILRINKFGRRICVPFFDLEPDSIFTGKPDKTNPDKVLCATKNYEIPAAIWIGKPDLESDDKALYENFENYRNKDNFSTGSFTLPKFIKGLFYQDFFLVNENNGYLNREKKKKDSKYKIQLMPVLDDRMHVVCWYGNTELVNKLNQLNNCSDFDIGMYHASDNREKKNHFTYENSDWWYSYIFVDTSPMHTDKFVKKNTLKEQTYSRWVGSGTLYGFSRFSFVMLTKSFSDLGSYNFLVRHLQSIYYKMAELCLLQRATVLSFSNEVTHVSNLIEKKKTRSRASLEKIDDLYKNYILFVNKIYFREVTAQEQGIEMYDLIQKIMRLKSDVEDLDNEIGELNQFASKEEAHNLTRLATIFLIPTLIASLLGMNVLPDFGRLPKFLLFEGEIVWPFWISLIFIAIITIVLVRYNLILKIYHFIRYDFIYQIRKYFRK